jgi:hypothetical protein
MAIIKDGNDYDRLRRDARLLYSKTKSIWCPALNDYVIFNREGFHHLIRKKGIPRLRSEQLRRFALLGAIKDIIANPKAVFTQDKRTVVRLRNRHGIKEMVPSPAYFWKFSEKRRNRTVKVVIRQFEKSSKHFLSVY